MSKVEEVMAAAEPLLRGYQADFGLSHWEIALDVRGSAGATPQGAAYKTAGRARYNPAEERGAIVLYADAAMTGAGDLRRVIRHEMLHLVASPLRAFLAFVGRTMISDATGRDIKMCVRSYEYFNEIMVRKLEIILDRMGDESAKAKAKTPETPPVIGIKDASRLADRIRDSLLLPLGLEQWRVSFKILDGSGSDPDCVSFADPDSVESPTLKIQPQYEQASLDLYIGDMQGPGAATRVVRRELLRLVAAPFHTLATIIEGAIEFHPRQRDAYWFAFGDYERQMVRNISRLVVNSQH